MPVTDKLPKHKPEKRPKTPKTPIWKGPEEDGVTQTLLAWFLSCRERFRLLVVEGLKPADTFNHRLEYGQMWHICEDHYAKRPNDENYWQQGLLKYVKGLVRRYRYQQEQVTHWYNICKTQFPIYVDYWGKHGDVKNRTPLLQEETFDVSYKLPSGRIVRLRGRWDSVDLVGEGKHAGIYLQENKTKGDIVEHRLRQQLHFDLQTMFYMVALTVSHQKGKNGLSEFGSIFGPIKGVRYNVIRRPLSGGKHSIRQHKPSKAKPKGESAEEFYVRLGNLIREDASHFFMRWKVEITTRDIDRFKQECLDPVLEHLCRWWKWIEYVRTGNSAHNDSLGPNYLHWRHPFGVYNPVNDGGSSDLDEYLETGSEVGLQRTNNLFPEL